jgi:hypothetical protein
LQETIVVGRARFGGRDYGRGAPYSDVHNGGDARITDVAIAFFKTGAGACFEVAAEF